MIEPLLNVIGIWRRHFIPMTCFCIIRPYCADGSMGRYVSLSACGFHEAFDANPQIIFRNRRRGLKLLPHRLNRICEVIVHYLSKGYWKEKGVSKWLERIGIAEPLLDDMDLLLAPIDTCGYNDYKKYTVNPGSKRLTGKIVVYTVLTGDYDRLKDPLFVTPGVDYILFTNQDIHKKVWKTVKVENEGLTDLMLSRRIKMLPQLYLPIGYDFNIYVDANVIIWGDISSLLTKLNANCHFAVTAHSVRNTVKDELDELVRLGKVKKELADSVYSRYQKYGFKDDLGLAECTSLIRRCNNKPLESLMQSWWREFSTDGLYRDQPSLMFCLSKEEFQYFALMDGHVMNNQYCTVIRHNNS